MIALHGAGSPSGAQLYMECAQTNIVGGTGTARPQTYSIPGIYKSNDPGLLVNIYSITLSSQYDIPGPPVFTCNGGGGGSQAGSGGGDTGSPAAPTPAPVDTGCTVPQSQQCGGTDYSGCTTCATGYTCRGDQ
ncbi:hypothetical protein VTK26DRAFT_1728 [Humicola hyalothermophila]